MAKINEITEQKIKDAASIMDVMQYDLGVQLHRSGAEYVGLCPFHEDRHLGSFKVSESKNIATCFSCGKTWNPIDALMEGLHMDYPTALRHLAARYGIYVDDQPAPKVVPAKPRDKAVVVKDLPMIYWKGEVIKPSLGHDEQNPLLQYLFALPLAPEHKERLMYAIHYLYFVGTATKAPNKGWTIWWQIDNQWRVRTGKLMMYNPDGHRNKTNPSPWHPNDTERPYTFDFIHAIFRRNKRYDPDKYKAYLCLFGLHLMVAYPDAEVCLVESEKSAVICSAFCDPSKRIWMATGGMNFFKPSMLTPLIEAKRYIVIYPDIDGWDKWKAIKEQIGYERMSLSNQVRKYWQPVDGEKADMADIMLRMVCAPQDTELDIIQRRLGYPANWESVKGFIQKLDLKLID